MTKQEYIDYLLIYQDYSYETLKVTFANGLKVKCRPFHGVAESDTVPGDEDYIGEYYTLVDQVEILEGEPDDSVVLENNIIEINLFNIADKIELEDGTVLWQNNKVINAE